MELVKVCYRELYILSVFFTKTELICIAKILDTMNHFKED